jgi:hypothetical protein
MPVVPGATVTATVSNTAYPLIAAGTHKLVKTLYIQPKYNNTGVGFVGDSTLNPSSDTGIDKQFAIPAANALQDYQITEAEAPNGIDLGNFYVASTVGGDKFYWSYDER